MWTSTGGRASSRGSTDAAELRLITCGGRFDARTGHYEDNVVVRAVRV
jgi:hypothetical protein